jgi:hypothetical protein
MINEEFEFMVKTRVTDAEAVKRSVSQHPGCFRFEPTAVGARWLEGKVIVTARDALTAEAYADTVIAKCNMVRVASDPGAA